MKCPSCGYKKTRVLDSRRTKGGTMKRRRECESCGVRWTTYEVDIEKLVEAIDMLKKLFK